MPSARLGSIRSIPCGPAVQICCGLLAVEALDDACSDEWTELEHLSVTVRDHHGASLCFHAEAPTCVHHVVTNLHANRLVLIGLPKKPGKMTDDLMTFGWLGSESITGAPAPPPPGCCQTAL